MISGLKKYWNSVRDIAAKLDPESAAQDAAEQDPAERYHLERSTKEIFLMSLDSEAFGGVAGMVVNTNPRHAAECLKKQTHRLATDTEIAGWREEMDRRRVEIMRVEKERRRMAGPDSSELAEAIAGAIVSSQKPARGARAAAE